VTKLSFVVSLFIIIGVGFGAGCGHAFSESTGWVPQAPGPDADPKAQALIDQMWAAMGVLPTYQTAGELRFTFTYSEGSKEVSKNFYWNRFEHRMRSEESTQEGDWLAVRTDLENHHGLAYAAKRQTGDGNGGPGTQMSKAGGKAAAKAPEVGEFERLPTEQFPRLEKASVDAFQLGRRWLLGPLNLRDKGVHVTTGPDEAAPGDDAGKKYQVLKVSYDPGADVDHPGDEVTWLIDSDTHLPVWMFVRQAGAQGRSAWSQEEWQTVGGNLKLPTLHKQYHSEIKVHFANVQANPRPSDELYFESLK
jgi:hypothetical protein